MFVNDSIGGGIQDVLRKNGEEVFLGQTLESKG